MCMDNHSILPGNVLAFPWVSCCPQVRTRRFISSRDLLRPEIKAFVFVCFVLKVKETPLRISDHLSLQKTLDFPTAQLGIWASNLNLQE